MSGPTGLFIGNGPTLTYQKNKRLAQIRKAMMKLKAKGKKR